MAEGFTCAVDVKYRSACEQLGFYGEHEGERYCVLHFPGEEKREDFEQVRKSKLAEKNYDFGGTFFPEGSSNFEGAVFDANANFAGTTFAREANFSGTQFSGERTSFEEALFRGEVRSFEDSKSTLHLGEANFSGAHFSGERTNFQEAQFGGVFQTFQGVQFGSQSTYFDRAQFSGRDTNFNLTSFSGMRTNFDGAPFSSETTNFNGAHFSNKGVSHGGTHFTKVQFGGVRTDFTQVQFSGAIKFQEAQFSSKETDFSEKYDQRVQFSGEQTDFSGAHFSGDWIDFSGAQFSGEQTDFSGALFSGDTYFTRTKFFSGAGTTFQEAKIAQEVSFREATFTEGVAFWGSTEKTVFDSQAWAEFHGSRIEKPELFLFNTVLLHLGWFINADVRRVNFTDVMWYGMPGGPEGTLDREIKALKKRNVESPHTLLAQACRRLSVNAEENREYPLANEFHYWSMDALRKERWSRFKGLTPRSLTKKESWRDIGEHFGLITTLYWALSGYGVRAARAFWVLMGMWALFAVCYMVAGPPKELRAFSVTALWQFLDILIHFLNPNFVILYIRAHLLEMRALSASAPWQSIEHAWQALVYSLAALARLNPEPKPDAPGLFQFLVTAEGILGPLQIALLALAVRRKVMR